MTVVRLADLERVEAAGVHWRPLRRALGVTAFKTNAYSADAGERLIEAHTEANSGQEELYLLVSGAATFDVDGTETHVEAGSVVFYADPAATRGAVATENGTLAVAVGNRAGAAGPVSAWEHRFLGVAVAREGDPERGSAIVAQALEDHPDDPGALYDLACIAAGAGWRERALEHWAAAVAADPRLRERAARDPDLDPVRDAL